MKELSELNAIYQKMSTPDVDEAMIVTNADKKGNTPAYQNMKKGMKGKDGKPMYKASDHMKEEEVIAHLDAVVEFINQTQPDVLLLQEVDRLSLRSAYIDQVQYILDRTHLNYGAYASQHKGDFLPSDGMGKMDFGNATLSRWPIESATRHALPLVDSQIKLRASLKDVT